MSGMFSKCKSINSLNLSNFDTSKVKTMSNMFSECSSLTSIDLSNFETSQVNIMDNMLYHCSLINVLDLSNFNLTNVNSYINMFKECQNLEYINLNISNINPNSATINIFSNTPDNLIVCFDDGDYKLIDLLPELKKYKCYNSYLNDKFKCYLRNSSLYNKHICDICEKKLLKIYSKLNNSNINLSCYESEDNYNTYIESTAFNFNESNISNSVLSGLYNNDSLEFYNDTYIFIYNSEVSLTNKTYLEYQYSIVHSSDINNDIITDTITQIKEKNETLQNIINNLIKKFDVTEIDNGEDKKIIEQNKTIVLTSTINQKNNEDKNYVSMDLGECENILKNNYNISKNNSLYILQIISEEEGMKIPKVEYEVYYPLYHSNNLTKLNLSLCKDTKIEISISVEIDGSIDKYNPKSDYYNDICSKTTSDSGTDITLKDRKNEYVNNNLSLCEENCELIGYNSDKGKVKCSCDVKLNIPTNDDIKFDKESFLKSFTDIKNIININIMKCYNIVLKINSLLENYGFLIVGSIIVFYFIDLLLFIVISHSNIKNEIYHIILELKIKGNQIIKKKNRIQKKGKKSCFAKNNLKNSENKRIKKIKSNSRRKNKLIIDKYNGQLTRNISAQSYIKMNANKNSIFNMNNKYDYSNFELKDFELNSLIYEEALKLDHRKYCQYYFSLLKYNHPLLFSFGSYNDYNSKVIKVLLFFISFCLDFAVNALFFTDDTMHKIYEDEGKFNFLYQIPQILYSSLISRFIDSFIRKFA